MLQVVSGGLSGAVGIAGNRLWRQDEQEHLKPPLSLGFACFLYMLLLLVLSLFVVVLFIIYSGCFAANRHAVMQVGSEVLEEQQTN